MSNNRYIMIGMVLFLGIIFQLMLYAMDQRNTPLKTAVRFTEAYLKLDDSMSQYLCQECIQKETDGDVTAQFLKYAAREARDLGMSMSMMRSKLYHLEATVISREADKAQIRITGEKKAYVNPVYAVIGYLFNLGQTTHYDEILNLVKENNRWKVDKNILNSFL